MAPMKRRHPLRRFFLGVLILAALAGWFWWQQNGLVTETYTIPGAPAAFQGYRIAVLSDLHGKQFGEDNQRLINYVAGLDPDCIALTGDFIDREAQKAHSEGGGPPRRSRPAARAIARPASVRPRFSP